MANERLYQFPSKASPTPSDIIYVGDDADAFNEVQCTIAQIIAAYPNLSGYAGLTLGANTYAYTNNSSVLTAGTITALAVTLLDDATTTAMRSTLGLVIGTDVQAFNAALLSIAGLTTVANELIYTTASNTYAVITSAASSVLITSAGSVPSLSQTLPSAVQTNITALGAQSQALNMNSHLINNVTDPSAAQDAATKSYVDTLIASVATVFVARLATTAALTVTYANGTAGVGATLTNAGAQAALSLDGVAAVVGNLVLVKNQASALQNGYYTVTNIGSGATNWVLTRSTLYDQPSEINPGDLFVITAGSTQANTSWIQTATVATIGTDSISFSQYSVALPIPVAQGGTGATTAVTARSNLSAAASGANADITSMTALSGVLQAPTAIASSAGLNVLAFSYTASAVNYITLANAATGNQPQYSATGTDSNISIAFLVKGDAQYSFLGNSTRAATLALYENTANGTSAMQVKASESMAASRVATFPDTDIACWVVQRVSTETGAVATGTTTVPIDDTIPQNTEGDQYMTLAITPKNTANILKIEITVNVSNSASVNNMITSLFQDSTANALATSTTFSALTTAIVNVKFTHIMSAGTTSSTTFKVRIGGNGAGTTTFNGAGGARVFGGVMASSIVITEYSS